MAMIGQQFIKMMKPLLGLPDNAPVRSITLQGEVNSVAVATVEMYPNHVARRLQINPKGADGSIRRFEVTVRELYDDRMSKDERAESRKAFYKALFDAVMVPRSDSDKRSQSAQIHSAFHRSRYTRPSSVRIRLLRGIYRVRPFGFQQALREQRRSLARRARTFGHKVSQYAKRWRRQS